MAVGFNEVGVLGQAGLLKASGDPQLSLLDGAMLCLADRRLRHQPPAPLHHHHHTNCYYNPASYHPPALLPQTLLSWYHQNNTLSLKCAHSLLGPNRAVH